MKRKKISFVIIISIVFLLSSCDISTLLDSFKGNAYEELFDLDLVGEQAQEAVEDIIESSEPDVVSQDTAIDTTSSGGTAGTGTVVIGQENGGVEAVESPQGVADPNDVPAAPVEDNGDDGISDDLVDGQVAVVDGTVPTLPIQDEDEKDVLKQTVVKSLAGEGEDDFIEQLENPAEDDQIVAAHNSRVLIEAVVEDINEGNTDGNGDDISGVVGTLGGLAGELLDELPQTPSTQSDILDVQLTLNLTNSIINAMNVIAGTGNGITTIQNVDTTIPEVEEALQQVISDVTIMLKIAKAQGSTSNLINSVNLTNIFNMLSERRLEMASKTTYSIGDDELAILNGMKDTIKLVLFDILGIDKDAENPTINEDKLAKATKNYTKQLELFNTFIEVSGYGLSYDDIKESDRDEYCGINGVINYTIATVLVNLQPVIDEYESRSGIPSRIATIDDLLSAFLAANPDILDFEDGFENSINIDGDLSNLNTIYDDTLLNQLYINDLDLENPGLNIKAIATKWKTNAEYLARLGIKNYDTSQIKVELFDKIEIPDTIFNSNSEE